MGRLRPVLVPLDRPEMVPADPASGFTEGSGSSCEFVCFQRLNSSFQAAEEP